MRFLLSLAFVAGLTIIPLGTFRLRRHALFATGFVAGSALCALPAAFLLVLKVHRLNLVVVSFVLVAIASVRTTMRYVRGNG